MRFVRLTRVNFTKVRQVTPRYITDVYLFLTNPDGREA